MAKDFIYDKEGNETRVGDKVWHNGYICDVIDILNIYGYIGVRSAYQEYELKQERDFYKYFTGQE